MRNDWEPGERDKERDCLQPRTWGPDPKALLKDTKGHQKRGEECSVLALFTGHIPVRTKRRTMKSMVTQEYQGSVNILQPWDLTTWHTNTLRGEAKDRGHNA